VRTRPFLLRFIAAGLVAVLCLPAADGPTAKQLYQKARKAEKAGHMSEAYLAYSEAAALDPQNQIYSLRMQALASRAALEAQIMPPASFPAPQPAPAPADDDADDPDNPDFIVEDATFADRRDAMKPLPPAELDADTENKDLDFTGNAEKLYQEVAHAYGLDVVFDPEYTFGNPFRFRMKDVDYRTALHALEQATLSFIVPLSNKLFLVARETPPKRQQLEPHVAVGVRLKETPTPQDFTAMVTAVQQTFALEKVAFDTQQNTVYLRGPISKVLPAKAMFEDLLKPRAQVMIEIRLMEVTRNDTLTYGVQLPSTFPIGLQPNLNLANIALNANAVYVVYTAVSASLVAEMTKNSGRTILDGELRTIDGQAATLHSGQRYPVLTAGYFGPASFSGPGAYTPPPSFAFQDLGLTMKVTPTVQNSQSLVMDVEAEFKVLTGAAVNGIPVIANRSMKSGVSLEFGQWAMVLGLLDTQDARTLSGIPALSSIPILGKAIGTREHDQNDDQVLILMRPQLITLPPNETLPHTFWVGSDNRPRSPF